jgi:hypothetical protein
MDSTNVSNKVNSFQGFICDFISQNVNFHPYIQQTSMQALSHSTKCNFDGKFKLYNTWIVSH